MVESLNTKVDFVIDATSFSGLTDYGKIMIGDKGFEFYHGRDPRKFIQIPWKKSITLSPRSFSKENGFRVMAFKRRKMARLSFLQKNLKKS